MAMARTPRTGAAQMSRMPLMVRSNRRFAAERSGEMRPSPMARSLGRKSEMGMRRSTRSANRCAGRMVTPPSRSRISSSTGNFARRSSDAMTMVSTFSSRTASYRLDAGTAMACGAIDGKLTTDASGASAIGASLARSAA